MSSDKNGKISIIGTHHFIEKELILKEIEEFNPDIVLVELCNGRITMIENPGVKPKEKFSILGMISKAIKKKADKEKKEFGSDMISAYKISKEKGIKVGLIDRPLVETGVFFGAIPMREKLILLKELMKFKSKKVRVNDIINEIESTETKDIINQIKSTCPTLHYYLITSRDEYMINKIKGYLYDHPDKRIICFVGEGHREAITKKIIKPIAKV